MHLIAPTMCSALPSGLPSRHFLEARGKVTTPRDGAALEATLGATAADDGPAAIIPRSVDPGDKIRQDKFIGP